MVNVDSAWLSEMVRDDPNVTRFALHRSGATRRVKVVESDGVLADHESTQVDRRQDVRVVAHGSVIVRGREQARGRLVNVSSGGMRVRLAETEPRCAQGEHVDVDLHLDRAGAIWLRFRGEVMRADAREIAIGFIAVPIDFADVVQDALVSALEGAAVSHVLLADVNTERRAAFAALLRKTGCRVVEAATPLEVIAHLGGSNIQSWVVVITDTVPTSIADELRRHLASSDVPPVKLVALGQRSPTSSLAWFASPDRT